MNDTRESIGYRGDNRLDAMITAISDDTGFCGVPPTCFASVTESDVMRLVAAAPCKSCELDPVATCVHLN